MEQYVNTCSNNLGVFLKERRPATLKELAEIAEYYLDAHSDRVYNQTVDHQREESSKRMDWRQDYGTSSKEPARQCFVCNSTRHLARRCPDRTKVVAMQCGGADGFEWRKGGVERNASRDLEHDREPDTDCNRENSRIISSMLGGGNQQKPQRQLELRCRAHARLQCKECNVTEEDCTEHLCNAMLADQVVL